MPYQEDSSDNVMNETEGDDEEDTLLFSCRCESARAVSTLLSSLRHMGKSVSASNDTSADRSGLSGSKSQLCYVYVTGNGVTFHVHGLGRQSQATADMQSGLFSDYYVSSENFLIDDENGGEPKEETITGGEFCVDLSTVLKCITVLGQASLDKAKIAMSYDRETCIFRLELEENGVISTCAILGSVADDNDENDGQSQMGLAVAFRRDKVVARAIVKSDYLKEAVSELVDMKNAGASFCTVGFGVDRIEMGAAGHSGECLVHLPKNPDIFVSLQCEPPNEHYARSYPLHSFLQGMRGLDIAHETCMTLNAKGMIAIQHQVLDTVGTGQPNYIDFIMGSLEDENDDEAEAHTEDDDESDTQSLALAIQQASNARLNDEESSTETDGASETPLSRKIVGIHNAPQDNRIPPYLSEGEASSHSRKSRKRRSSARNPVTSVTLTHQTHQTHYLDSSEDEYEFN